MPDEGNDELAELGRGFNAFVVKIQDAICDVGATTDQVASAAEELSRVGNETRASVQVQGSETDQIASAITEMASTIKQISGNANAVESAASDADKLAHDSGQTIANAQSSVNQLSKEIEASSTRISNLAGKTDEISQVLDVIHAVTDQTNLLALNAAIEAARSGGTVQGLNIPPTRWLTALPQSIYPPKSNCYHQGGHCGPHVGNLVDTECAADTYLSVSHIRFAATSLIVENGRLIFIGDQLHAYTTRARQRHKSVEHGCRTESELGPSRRTNGYGRHRGGALA